ncbi:MAG TPA: hypothetical protein VLE99_04590 [Candidatus Saccharimonadales bacterium]|nr:hypothetical protein [Candidatus Saccharimonadales bacterium]
MTNPEQMRPHELAEQLRKAGHEIVNGRVESTRLGDMLTRSSKVRSMLATNRFEENEFGYATIAIEDWESDYQQYSGGHVSALRVTYHDPQGYVVELGGVARTHGRSPLGTATISGMEGQEPLLPQDERWDAVVGTIERAIDTCYRYASNITPIER